ncbi:uncharacterized mitochondrial protein AtMg00810-like [Daucus carota subsp. sativus]|uniref:uncharacterized mitochondrial protein AtMg00810-like n=1 Tax=Daucus carota subsp. sativus TaxID=79200 RepID=UPI0007EF82AE|nr:PREDICTED: uncharacterized mitochondrial protein AtMg00810-like [Daucus carota subsp. sativus]
MKREFEMTDLGLLHFFLGKEIKQSNGGFFISQQKYAREVLKKFKMENANSVSTPVAVGLKLSKNDDSELIDPILFQSLVGNLMYLTATRLDIAYEVSLISSDWAGDHDDSKSTSGNVFFVGSGAISWMSKK